MPFIYDDETQSAVDRERGVSLKMAGDFLDAGLTFNYKFNGFGCSFKFLATFVDEKRRFFENGRHVEREVGIAYDIFEPSIKDGIKQSLTESGNREDFDKIYPAVKEAIREGMLLLGQRGGPPEGVPDFRISFNLLCL